MAKIGFDSTRLLEGIAKAATHRMDEFTSRELSNMAWSYAKVGLPVALTIFCNILLSVACVLTTVIIFHSLSYPLDTAAFCRSRALGSNSIHYARPIDSGPLFAVTASPLQFGMGTGCVWY
jgi:hypothetical protein